MQKHCKWPFKCILIQSWLQFLCCLTLPLRRLHLNSLTWLIQSPCGTMENIGKNKITPLTWVFTLSFLPATLLQPLQSGSSTFFFLQVDWCLCCVWDALLTPFPYARDNRRNVPATCAYLQKHKSEGGGVSDDLEMFYLRCGQGPAAQSPVKVALTCQDWYYWYDCAERRAAWKADRKQYVARQFPYVENRRLFFEAWSTHISATCQHPAMKTPTI